MSEDFEGRKATRMPLSVELIASTQLHEVTCEQISGWSAPADYASDGEWLIEFAGRACYQSWDRPNEATATNKGYLAHILDVGHLSVVEHAIATFYLQGVSRSLTHELVRHRHFSYSQLSQRFVNSSDPRYVLPPALEGHEEGIEGVETFLEATSYFYDHLVEGLEEELKGDTSIPATQRRKRAREAARAILANCIETKIVVTGNLRAWRHFISLRATEHADAEIRNVALAILGKLKLEFAHTFEDFTYTTLPDGTVTASTTVEAH